MKKDLTMIFLLYKLVIEKNTKPTTNEKEAIDFSRYGGFNIIDFKSNDKYIVKRQNLNSKNISRLEKSLVLCFTEITRISNKIEKKVRIY